MITLKPDESLSTRQLRARLAVEVAQEQLHEVLLADVARIVRDALPTATYLVLEINDQHHYNRPPYRVGVRSIFEPGGCDLWARNQNPGTTLADYRTSDGTAWPEVVTHLEHLLTTALGAEIGGMWWEPEEDEAGQLVFWCKLPAAQDVADIQAEQPRHLVAYLDNDGALPWGAVWFSRPIPRPTMSVAGVAITASVADDGVLTVEIDPTKTHPKMMAPAGPGTPIRVRVADTAVTAPLPAETGDADDDEPEVCATEDCATEDCDGNLDDGEGWNGFCGSCADRIYAPEHGDQDDDTATDGGETRGNQPGTELDLTTTAPLALGRAAERVERPAPSPDTPVEAVSQLKELLAWYDGDGEMRYHDTVEDGRHDNGRRAGFAAIAVLVYAARTGLLNDRNDEEPTTVLGDLLGDLRHLADSLGLDFGELNGHGEFHYEPELRGDF